jgi:hypothetical protein
LGYYFDLVFRPDVATQDEVLERLRHAGAEKFPPVPDPDYPEPGPGGPRIVQWRGERAGWHILDILARPAVPRGSAEAGAGEAVDARATAWGPDVGWISIRESWGTGRQMVEVLLDLLDLAGLVGARLWDGQTGKFVTRDLVAEAARDYQDRAAAVGDLLGAVDDRKHRLAPPEDGVDRRQGRQRRSG